MNEYHLFLSKKNKKFAPLIDFSLLFSTFKIITCINFFLMDKISLDSHVTEEDPNPSAIVWFDSNFSKKKFKSAII